MQKRMIFHYPFPLPEAGTSGSKVRLTHMIGAFGDLGYEVEMVSGYVDQRKSSIRRLIEQEKKGKEFDFVYSESSTLPTLMSKRNIVDPFLDFEFFGWCRRKSIPIGLFYRDIHWKFNQYKISTPWYRRIVALPFYWYDGLQHLQLVNFLFLPSIELGNPQDLDAELYSHVSLGDLVFYAKNETSCPS